MGIRGTVRRSTDGHLIHANVDTDIIISEEPPYGKSTQGLARVVRPRSWSKGCALFNTEDDADASSMKGSRQKRLSGLLNLHARATLSHSIFKGTLSRSFFDSTHKPKN